MKFITYSVFLLVVFGSSDSEARSINPLDPSVIDGLCGDGVCADKSDSKTKEGGGEDYWLGSPMAACERAEWSASNAAKADAKRKAKASIQIPRCDEGCEAFGPVDYTDSCDESTLSLSSAYDWQNRSCTGYATINCTVTAVQKCISSDKKAVCEQVSTMLEALIQH